MKLLNDNTVLWNIFLYQIFIIYKQCNVSLFFECSIKFSKHSLQKSFILIFSVIIIIGLKIELVAIIIHKPKYILNIKTVKYSIQLNPSHAFTIVPILSTWLFKSFVKIVCHVICINTENLMIDTIQVRIILLDQAT